MAVVALSAAPARAQFIGISFGGIATKIAIPTGTLADSWKVGFGGGLGGEHRLRDNNWAIDGDIGYMQFLGKTTTSGGFEQHVPNVGCWEFSGGARYTLGDRDGPVFVGADAGYFVFSLNGSQGIADQWGVLPTIGFRANAFRIAARYKVLGDAHWVDVRLSLRRGF